MAIKLPREKNMSNKGQLLQDPFLNTLRKEHVPVSIYLVNGIKLQGQIESFDQYVVLLRGTPRRPPPRLPIGRQRSSCAWISATTATRKASKRSCGSWRARECR